MKNYQKMSQGVLEKEIDAINYIVDQTKDEICRIYESAREDKRGLDPFEEHEVYRLRSKLHELSKEIQEAIYWLYRNGGKREN